MVSTGVLRQKDMNIKEKLWNRDIRNGMLTLLYWAAFVCVFYQSYTLLKEIDVEYNYNMVTTFLNTPITWIKVYHLISFLGVLLTITIIIVLLSLIHI